MILVKNDSGVGFLGYGKERGQKGTVFDLIRGCRFSVFGL